jgi:hypothetical protein
MMTDEECRKLVGELREYDGYDKRLNALLHQAADELERLTVENKRLQNELRLWKEQG